MKESFPVNLALDTSFFVKNNFLVGKNFFRLKSLVNDGIISIFLTDITYREIQNRFKINLIGAVNKVEKHVSFLEKDGMILKNFPEYLPYFRLPNIHLEIID